MTNSGERFESLDLWRGFAALWVTVFHATAAWTDLPHTNWGLIFLGHGWLGVQLFFVISGYCITEKLSRSYQSGETATRFLLDRFLRIYPTYWVSLIILAIANTAGALVKHQSLSHPGVYPHGMEIPAALFAIEPWLGLESYLLVAWTLAYEVGFYLLAAFGLWIAQQFKSPRLGFTWAIALVAAGLIPGLSQWSAVLHAWPEFALGIAVWWLCHHVSKNGMRIVLSTLITMLVFSFGWMLSGHPSIKLACACLCAWAILLCYQWDQRVHQFTGLRWLGWIGTFSYSLYLIHVPISGKIRNLLSRSYELDDIRMIIGTIISCVIAIGAAWLFYRAFELPFERMRRKIMRSMRPATL